MKKKKSNSWDVLDSEKGPDLVLFKVRFDTIKNPRNSYTIKAVILEAPDWVNVLALTKEGKILVVRQHRFGINKETIEVPAGLVDPGETSRQAAERELKEETGFTSQKWTYLGYVEPNPAFMDNLCHTWLAEDVVKTHTPKLDEGENLVVLELTKEQLIQEIRQGRMRNSLALIALSHKFDLRNMMSNSLEFR